MDDNKNNVTKKIEIYTLAKNLESVSVQTNENEAKVVIDLRQPEEEAKKLNDNNLMPPIREAEKFKAIKDMRYAEKLIQEGQTSPNLEEIVKIGNQAIDCLMTTFWNSAYTFGKNWIHEDRLNGVDDWFQILKMTLHKAILDFDLNKETQFNTFLNYQVMAACKAKKCQSTALSVNASAMQKALNIKKIKEELKRDGLNENDIDLIAKKLGRDISTPNKRENFRKTLLDMEMISPQCISTESTVDSSSRTFGESLKSENTLDPFEYLEVCDLKDRFLAYYASLDDDSKNYVIKIMGGTPKKEIPHVERCQKRLHNQQFFKLLKEMEKYKDYGISFIDFLE